MSEEGESAPCWATKEAEVSFEDEPGPVHVTTDVDGKDADITKDCAQFEDETMNCRDKSHHNCKRLCSLAMEMVPCSSKTRPFTFGNKRTIQSKCSIGLSIMGILIFLSTVFLILNQGDLDDVILSAEVDY